MTHPDCRRNKTAATSPSYPQTNGAWKNFRASKRKSPDRSGLLHRSSRCLSCGGASIERTPAPTSGEDQQAADNGEVLLEKQELRLSAKFEMRDQRGGDGEGGDHERRDAGLEADDDRKTADEFEQADERRRRRSERAGRCCRTSRRCRRCRSAWRSRRGRTWRRAGCGRQGSRPKRCRRLGRR